MSDDVELCPDCGGKGRRPTLHKATKELHHVPCACTVKDLPLKFVYQPEACGCIIAAVAMAIGRTYRDVRQYVTLAHDFTREGTYSNVAHAVLDRLGYAVQERHPYDPRLEGPRPVWPCEPWADIHLCEVRNLPDTGQHAVVLLRDGRVLDPWWGVVQGLHRYSRVVSMTAVYRVDGFGIPVLSGRPAEDATPLQLVAE